ncbi:hypothetical protein HY634_01790 [Candidatus Uhrbacteria bacterium]|nr:hypothetical protein [Candidatus Uhrbacteria bacterium]
MQEGEGTVEARNGSRRVHRARTSPLRKGEFLTLVRMSFGMGEGDEDGALRYTGRVSLHVGPVDFECRGIAHTSNGTVSALDLAFRDALKRVGQEVPELRLWPYRIRLSNRAAGIDSPVTVDAKVALNGWRAHPRVQHQDSVTAAAFLLFDVYDDFLYRRWREHIRVAHLTETEALDGLRRAANGGDE